MSVRRSIRPRALSRLKSWWTIGTAELKPGFFAKGVIFTHRDENVIAIPEDAISTLAGVSNVYVIENGKARQQMVRWASIWEISVRYWMD